MNIAIVAGTASREPFLIPPDENVRGYANFAHLYPEYKTWNVHPAGFHRIEAQTDLILFIPNSEIRVIDAMIQIANRRKIVSLVQDSDPPATWLHLFPSLTQATIDLFDTCDAVAVHSPNQINVVSSFTDTPVFYLPEPNWVASNFKEIKGEDRRWILAPTTHCASYNSHRYAMLNYAVLKRLLALQAEGEIDPGFNFGVVANETEAHAGDLHAHEEDLLARIGLDALQLEVWGCAEMRELLAETALFVNLDATNAVGHWIIECAALKTPILCSDSPDAARQLYPDLQLSHFDVETAVRIGHAYLNQALLPYVDEGFGRVNHYSYQSVRFQLDSILQTLCRGKNE